MKIDLRDLEEGVNSLVFDENAEDLSLEDAGLSFAAPIHTALKVVKVGDSLSATGTTSFCLQLECVRCLEAFEQSLTADFQFLFQRGEPSSLEEEEDETILWLEEEVGHFDLSEDVRDYVLLEVPMNPTCEETCKGLCSSCGTNLNDETCSCARDEPDARWDALRALKQNL